MTARTPSLVTAALLLGALACLYARLLPMVASSQGDFDAVHLYLPLARGLAEQGLAFLADPRSLQAPPFSYIYPALLGADLRTLKIANAVLAGVTLLTLSRCAWLMHSRLAAVLTAFLFAFSPTLRPHLATPITEGPYLLLGTLWFWGLAEWVSRGRPWALAVSAFAIALATLTRATAFYGLVLLVAAAGLVAWRARADTRAAARAALFAYGGALLAVGLFVAKNWLLFGFAFFTTGGGNALYLGHNPLTGGYDPNYLGLYFDVGAIARNQSQLTLEAERLLRGVARIIIGEKDLGFLVELHLRKLAAFWFVTGAEPDAAAQRAWRIVLPVMALGAFGARASRGLVGLAFAVLAYQVAIHVPVLYTHRYSVDAIDTWLILLAAIGLAHWIAAGAMGKLAAASAAAALGAALGIWQLSVSQPMPDVFAAARRLVWEAPSLPRGLSASAAAIELPLANAARLDTNYNHVLVVEAVSGGGQAAGCGEIEVQSRLPGATAFGPAITFRLLHGGVSRRYQFGAVPLGLTPERFLEGTLRVTGRCGAGATVEIRRVALYASLGPSDYRARLLGEAPPAPLER